MSEKTSAPSMENAYQLDGWVPFGSAALLGLQHVLAMFAGNLTPVILITGACNLQDLQVSLLQNAMLVAGIVTLVQLFTIGPVGAKLPIVMGTSSGFIGISNNIISMMGGGVLAYGTLMGASLVGGLLEAVLGLFTKPIRKFFPSVVTGTVAVAVCVASFQTTSAPICSNRNRIGTKVRSFSVTGGCSKPRSLSFNQT